MVVLTSAVDISLINITTVLNRFTQGVYLGTFAGVTLSAWVFIGSVFYPPDKNPGVRSVRECPFYQDALQGANASFANGTYYNTSMAILDKYGDGLIGNPYKPYTR